MVSLVTGAAGFLGTSLTRQLRARGEAVVAFDLAGARWDRIAGTGAVRLDGDITRRGSVLGALDGVSRIFHVAALYELGTRDPLRMEAINVGGTRNVLEAAHARGIPVVYVSSVAALGPTGAAPADESHWNAGAPRSAYEGTKRAAHELARSMARGGARIRIGLPATIYGVGDPSMIGKAHAWLANGAVRAFVKPEMRLAFVHVDDCAEGLMRIADRGEDFEQYILSSDVVTLREWMLAFARASGRPAPRFTLPAWLVDASGAAAARLPSLSFSLAPLRLLRDATAMADGADWAFSGDKARRELGWSPRAFDAGLREVASSLKNPSRVSGETPGAP